MFIILRRERLFPSGERFKTVEQTSQQIYPKVQYSETYKTQKLNKQSLFGGVSRRNQLLPTKSMKARDVWNNVVETDETKVELLGFNVHFSRNTTNPLSSTVVEG